MFKYLILLAFAVPAILGRSSGEIATPYKNVGSDEIATPYKKVGSDEIATPYKKVGSDEIATPYKKVGSDEIATPYKYVGSDEIATPYKKINSEEIATPYKKVGSDEIATPYKYVGSDEIATPYKFGGSDEIATPYKKVGSDEIATPYKKVGSDEIATPYKKVGSDEIATPYKYVGSDEIATPYKFGGSDEIATPYGSIDETATPFVHGGLAALVGEYASECSLDTPLQLHCQGTLLNSGHIITAASCVVNPVTSAMINPSSLRVTCGDNSLFVIGGGREVRTVSHIFPHEQYNPITHNNDLAILRLSNPINLPHNMIEEAILQDRIVPELTNCNFAGWGASHNASNVLTANKMVISAPVVNRINCNNLANAGRIEESMLCAGIIAGVGTPPLVAQSVCRGNVGGGLYCNNRLSGVLSFGLSCGNPNQPGVYIQPRFYTQWINQQFARNVAIPVGTVFPRAD